jgi:hypothetical protein
MRANKGFGRTWARRWRIRAEGVSDLEKAKRIAPVHVAASFKGEALVERVAKVVIPQFIISLLGPMTARKRRKVAARLRFELRENF